VDRSLDPRSLGAPDTSKVSAVASSTARPEIATAALPSLRPVSDEEALGSSAPTIAAATPLLDQGLRRAQLQQEAILAEPVAAPLALATTDPAPDRVAASTPAPVRFEPTPTTPNDTAPIRASMVDPEVKPAASEVAAPETTTTAPAPEPAPVDAWKTGLDRLRATAQARLDEGGDDASLWELRGRLLAWMAEDPARQRAKADGPLWTTVLSLLAAASDDDADDTTAAVRAIESNAPLAVTELVLCRKVHGFGQFDPIEGTTCQAGQRVLLYCEVAGLKYEPMPDGDSRLRSRLASRLEVLSEGDAKPRWSLDLGTAEDLCRRARRDYYVNYRLDLPGATTLPPGSYRLRIVQTDTTTGQETDRSIPITVLAAATAD
jgi:hypothetical protein